MPRPLPPTDRDPAETGSHYLPVVLSSDSPTTLYGTTDPAEILALATRQADVLSRVIEQKGLYASMGSSGGAPCERGHDRCAKTRGGPCTERRHVLYDAWALCGTLLGVYAVVVDTAPLADAEGIWQEPIVEETWETVDGRRRKEIRVLRPGRGGWKATAEARTRDGAVVGGDSQVCTWDETRWKTRSSSEVLGMAQTRAKGRALRGPLGFVVALAGYVPTPAEEMAEATPARLVYGPDGSLPPIDFGPALAASHGDPDVALRRYAYNLAGGDRAVAKAAYEQAVADAYGDAPVDDVAADDLLWDVGSRIRTALAPTPEEAAPTPGE